MKVKELFFSGETNPALYACGECGKLSSPKTYATTKTAAHLQARYFAEQCCAPRYCACGVEIESSGWLSCAPCREKDRLRKAVILDAGDYNDAVFSEDVDGGWGEGFSSCVDEMLEWCADYDVQPPSYCYPCKPKVLAIDIEGVLDNIMHDWHEGSGDQIIDYPGLVNSIDAWNAKQTCTTYYPDMSRVIVLDQDSFDALLD